MDVNRSPANEAFPALTDAEIVELTAYHVRHLISLMERSGVRAELVMEGIDQGLAELRAQIEQERGRPN